MTPKMVRIEGVKTPPNVPNPEDWDAGETVEMELLSGDDFTFRQMLCELELAYYYRLKLLQIKNCPLRLYSQFLQAMKDLKNRW